MRCGLQGILCGIHLVKVRDCAWYELIAARKRVSRRLTAENAATGRPEELKTARLFSAQGT
jgi:hypothetical protein